MVQGTVDTETLSDSEGGGAVLALQKTLESKPRGRHILIAFGESVLGSQQQKFHLAVSLCSSQWI